MDGYHLTHRALRAHYQALLGDLDAPTGRSLLKQVQQALPEWAGYASWQTILTQVGLGHDPSEASDRLARVLLTHRDLPQASAVLLAMAWPGLTQVFFRRRHWKIADAWNDSLVRFLSKVARYDAADPTERIVARLVWRTDRGELRSREQSQRHAIAFQPLEDVLVARQANEEEVDYPALDPGVWVARAFEVAELSNLERDLILETYFAKKPLRKRAQELGIDRNQAFRIRRHAEDRLRPYLDQIRKKLETQR